MIDLVITIAAIGCGVAALLLALIVIAASVQQ